MKFLRLPSVLMFTLIFTMGYAGFKEASHTDGQITFIHAGRFFDSEAGTFVPSRDIVVKGNMVESIGEKLTAPAGSRTIDLTNYTVLPGLIDSHTHLLYLENPSGGLSMEGVKALVMEGTPLRALHGAARGRTFLMAGITTVRDLGNSGQFGDVALRTAINDGSVDGPRMWVSGPGLSPEGGQFPGLQHNHRDLAEEEYRIVRGPVDAAAAVRENVTYGATVIKIYSNNTPNPLLLSLDEMRAIVAEAHLLGVKVAAHATSNLAVSRAAEAGVDSIEHAYQVEDATLKLMKDKGVVMVPTDIDVESMSRYLERAQRAQQTPQQKPPTKEEIAGFIAPQQDRLRRALKIGVTVAAGSDDYLDLGMPQGEAAKRVLFSYRDSGMDAAQVLQCATLNAARLIGDRRLGTIKPGAYADIIAVEGDPAADFGAMERVRFVMKNGTVYLERK